MGLVAGCSMSKPSRLQRNVDRQNRLEATIHSVSDCPSISSINLRMSEHFHAVMFGASFTGFGKRPFFTPAHQVDLLTGIIGGIGG